MLPLLEVTDVLLLASLGRNLFESLAILPLQKIQYRAGFPSSDARFRILLRRDRAVLVDLEDCCALDVP